MRPHRTADRKSCKVGSGRLTYSRVCEGFCGPQTLNSARTMLFCSTTGDSATTLAGTPPVVSAGDSAGMPAAANAPFIVPAIAPGESPAACIAAPTTLFIASQNSARCTMCAGANKYSR